MAKNPPNARTVPRSVTKQAARYQLADVVAVQTGLHHDGVDNRHRCGAKRNATDLRSVEMPAQDIAAEEESASERKGERDDAYGDARFPVAAQRHGVDLGSGQKRQEYGSEVGKERREACLHDVLFESGKVAADGSDEDLDESDRHADPDADE